jgi:hypothetical protein
MPPLLLKARAERKQRERERERVCISLREDMRKRARFNET